MLETDPQLDALQALLERSRASSTEHLRSIIGDEQALSAREITALMTGMRVLALATVTGTGEPRISGVDGHLLHARWVFTTSGTAAKARHLRSRPGVSAAHIDGEDIAIFTHGRVAILEPGTDEFASTLTHLTEHYGSSPLSWGPDIVVCRIEPSWMVGYAFHREELLAARGVQPDPATRA